MSLDFSLELRKACVTAMKADAGVTALVSASRIFGEAVPENPEYPMIRYGFPIAGQYEATRLDGIESRVTIHAFARGKFTDDVLRMGKAIVTCIEGVDMSPLAVMDSNWVQSNVVRDTDAQDIWHLIVQFDLIVAEVAA